MRILEKGEDKVYIKRCGNCDSLIEFERTDVVYDPLFLGMKVIVQYVNKEYYSLQMIFYQETPNHQYK